MTQNNRTAHLRQLHERRPLVLPNAWDAASARVLERSGALAIGTTSAGVSWARGHPDGEALRRKEMIEAVRRVVQVVDVPVTADIESGYGTGSSADVALTTKLVVEAGAVGINLEDAPGRDGDPLLPGEEHARRIRSARTAGVEVDCNLVINARTDVYLAGVGTPETRFDETARRATLYRAAGADCVFVPGVVDAQTIGALVREVDVPLNVMAGPGSPPIEELGELGVARVSVGPGIALAALAVAERAAVELLEEGTYGALDRGLAFTDVQAMFGRG